MAEDSFVYVIYIRTTAEKLWDALTKPEFTRAYWAGTWQETTWEKGASWKIRIPDGRVADSGEVIEADPPRRLVVSWRNEFRPELHEEGYSRRPKGARPPALHRAHDRRRHAPPWAWHVHRAPALTA
jgi:uncharacterized protein YndB with AHSA1/START domain